MNNSGDSNTDETEGGAATRRLYSDAYALTASTVSSGAAGAICSIVIARLFSTEIVGAVGALTSAMLLLSGVSQLDLANALHRFLPGSGHSAKKLILGSYAAAAIVSFVVTLLFVALFGGELFGPHRFGAAFWFAGAVVAWSLFNLQDQVLMGLGKAIIVPVENTIFGLARIGLVIAFVGGGSYAVFATWIIPVVVLLVCVSAAIVWRVFPEHVKRSGVNTTMWDFRTVSRFVAGGYVGGVTTLAVSNIIPLIVLAYLGKGSTGHFYMAWLVLSNLDLVALNFGVSFVVQGATNPTLIRQLLIATLRRQIILIGPAILILVLFAPELLNFFGAGYGREAGTMLRLLALGMIPRLLWLLYLPAMRLQRRIKQMTLTQIASGVLVLAGSWIGLANWGLTGLGWGWLTAQSIMAVVLIPKVLMMIRASDDDLDAPDSTQKRKPQRRRRGPVELLLISLYEDVRIAFHGFFVNRLAASILMPRVGRFIIYRTFRMQFQTANIFYGAQFADGHTRLGKGTFVNTNVHFEDVAPVTIGEDCQIGMEVLFVTSHHDTVEGFISKEPNPLPITVGDRCWIGARAMILPGVNIADDCVIAAGAVVTKDCEANGVYAGVPAKRIKELGLPQA